MRATFFEQRPLLPQEGAVDVELEDVRMGKQLALLFNRKCGQIVRINDGGELSIVKRLDLRARFHYWKERLVQRERIKGAIAQSLEALGNALNPEQFDANQKNILQKFLKRQFVDEEQGSFARMRGDVYERASLTPPLETLLYGIKFQHADIELGEEHWRYRINGKHIFHQDQACQQADRIQLAIADARIARNLTLLLNRQRGEILQADQDGNCTLIGRFEFKARFNYWRHREAERARVKEVVDSALQALSQALNQCDDRHGALQEFLQSRFFKRREGTLARMRTDIYDRGLVTGALETFLAHKDWNRAKEALKITLKRCDGSAHDALYEFCCQENLFAKDLGLRDRLIDIDFDGSGGPRFGYSRRGDKIVVIKPGDEGPYGKNNPSWTSRFKQHFLSPRSCLRGNSEPFAEHFSSRISQVLGLNNVPRTHVEDVVGEFRGPMRKECSVQLFVDGTKTLGKYLGVSRRWQSLPKCLRSCFRRHLASRPLPEIPQELFEFGVLTKFLTGDIDTHFENMLIKKRDDEELNNEFLNAYDKGIATNEQIDAFVEGLFSDKRHYHLLDRLLKTRSDTHLWINHDGGASFPNAHPLSSGLDGYLSLRFRFLFEALPACNHPFSQAVREAFLDPAQHRRFARFVLELGISELIGSIGDDAPMFRRFWVNHKEDRVLFRNWLLEKEGDKELQVLARRLAALKSFATEGQYKPHFLAALVRIRGICTALIDRYRLLLTHLENEPEEPQRTLFQQSDRASVEQRLRQATGRHLDEFDAILAQEQFSASWNFSELISYRDLFQRATESLNA